MVATRGSKKGDSSLPPRSPQARHTGTSRVAAASVASRRSRGASTLASSADSSVPTESDFEPEIDSDDDIPADQNTDKFLPPPQYKRVATAQASSSGSVVSAGSNRGKLEFCVEKQVLKDIEESGGLHLFEKGKTQGLSQLLDNPDRRRLYGERGDGTRKKISRRVRYLKQLPYQQYIKLLTSYKIDAAKLTKAEIESIESAQPVKSIQTKAVKKEDVSDLEDEDDDASFQPERVVSSSTPRKKSIKSPSVIFSPRSSIKPDLVSSRASLKIEPVVSSSASKNSHSFKPAPSAAVSSVHHSRSTMDTDDDLVDIWLNPAEPFHNPEGIMLSRFTGYQYNGSEYEGLTILLQGDPRDVSADRFELKVFNPPDRAEDNPASKPCNKFLLTMPLVPASMWMDRDELVGDETAHQAVKNGLLVTMQSVKDLPVGANKKEFVIGIKGGDRMKLTDVPFIPADEPVDSLVIKPFHPVTFYETGLEDEPGKPIMNMGTFVSWRLCDIGSKRKMEDDAKKGPSGKAGMAAALAARRKRAKQAQSGSMTGSRDAAVKPTQPVVKSSPGGMDIDNTEDLEEQMMSSMGKIAPEDYDISEEGWEEIAPLLNQYVAKYGGTTQELYDISRQISINEFVNDEEGYKSKEIGIEDLLIYYVKAEVEKGLNYVKQQEQSGNQSSSNTAALLEENRKELFKPVAESSRDARENAAERIRQNKRLQKLNKARNNDNKPLQMEGLLGESITEAQQVLNETGSGLPGAVPGAVQGPPDDGALDEEY